MQKIMIIIISIFLIGAITTKTVQGQAIADIGTDVAEVLEVICPALSETTVNSIMGALNSICNWVFVCMPSHIASVRDMNPGGFAGMIEIMIYFVIASCPCLIIPILNIIYLCICVCGGVLPMFMCCGYLYGTSMGVSAEVTAQTQLEEKVEEAVDEAMTTAIEGVTE